MDSIEYNREYLSRLSCTKIKKLCKEVNIKGYTKFKEKDELIEYILNIKSNSDENKKRRFFYKKQLIQFYKKVKRINYKKFLKEEDDHNMYEEIRPSQLFCIQLIIDKNIQDFDNLSNKNKIEIIKNQEEFDDIEIEFGDIITIEMDTNNKHYYIGKENQIIYSNEIPIEITKYLKNAYKYYSEMFKKSKIGKKINDNFIIDLRINDEFVKENTIGYIKKEWDWKIKYNNKDK